MARFSAFDILNSSRPALDVRLGRQRPSCLPGWGCTEARIRRWLQQQVELAGSALTTSFRSRRGSGAMWHHQYLPRRVELFWSRLLLAPRSVLRGCGQNGSSSDGSQLRSARC